MGGSLTWIDWHEGTWWAAFGMYSGKKAEPGKDPSWTTIIQFDQKWRRLQGWVFPPDLVEEFAPSTNSGGCWGHDYFEVYVVKTPNSGSTVEYVRTVAVASFGQGIVWDRFGEPLLWGIDRKKKRMVMASRVPFERK